jgi:thiol-disulfide isomerase/thioredoxin
MNGSRGRIPTYLLATLAVLCVSVSHAGLAGRERKALREIETSPARGFEPRLVLNDNADRWDAESFHGRLTIVNFWATFCPPCLDEMPLLEQAHREWKELGVRVFGVTSVFDEDEETALAAIRETLETAGVSYPVLISDEQAEWDGYRAKGLPVTVLVDRDGKPIEYALGAKGLRRLLQRVEEILGMPTPDRKDSLRRGHG